MSAPLVSFTAALLRASWDGDVSWADLKRRILASADVVEPLIGRVDDGRLLEPVRALAIREDVLKITGGAVIFGRLRLLKEQKELRDGDIIDFDCSDGTRPLRIGDLLKVVPRFPKSDGEYTTKIYAMPGSNDDRLMHRLDCKQPNDLVVEMTEAESGAKHNYVLDQIADIVPRTMR
jgi:hypothetical protein